MPQLYVKVADTAPDEPALTEYDKEHAVTYARLLDAEADNADWREVARIVLHIDPTTEPERARLAFDSHLARAKWVPAHLAQPEIDTIVMRQLRFLFWSRVMGKWCHVRRRLEIRGSLLKFQEC